MPHIHQLYILHRLEPLIPSSQYLHSLGSVGVIVIYSQFCFEPPCEIPQRVVYLTSNPRWEHNWHKKCGYCEIDGSAVFLFHFLDSFLNPVQLVVVGGKPFNSLYTSLDKVCAINTLQAKTFVIIAILIVYLPTAHKRID